jgi:hypothetical protein
LARSRYLSNARVSLGNSRGRALARPMSARLDRGGRHPAPAHANSSDVSFSMSSRWTSARASRSGAQPADEGDRRVARSDQQWVEKPGHLPLPLTTASLA